MMTHDQRRLLEYQPGQPKPYLHLLAVVEFELAQGNEIATGFRLVGPHRNRWQLDLRYPLSRQLMRKQFDFGAGITLGDSDHQAVISDRHHGCVITAPRRTKPPIGLDRPPQRVPFPSMSSGRWSGRLGSIYAWNHPDGLPKIDPRAPATVAPKHVSYLVEHANVCSAAVGQGLIVRWVKRYGVGTLWLIVAGEEAQALIASAVERLRPPVPVVVAMADEVPQLVRMTLSDMFERTVPFTTHEAWRFALAYVGAAVLLVLQTDAPQPLSGFMVSAGGLIMVVLLGWCFARLRREGYRAPHVRRKEPGSSGG